MENRHILIVDDEAGIRSSLAGILGDEGYEVTAVETAEAGLELLEQESFDAVLLCMGAEHSRDLPVEGRDLEGVEFAMDFLPQANKRCRISLKGVGSPPSRANHIVV